MTEELKHTALAIDPLHFHQDCLAAKTCDKMIHTNIEKLSGRYIGINEANNKQVPSACLKLHGVTFENYSSTLHKKTRWLSRQPEKLGYKIHRFNRRTFIPDIVEIHTSKEVRSGGEMKPAYKRTVEELGGAPKKFLEPLEINCPLHYDTWWGIFAPIEGYKQGNIITNEKLIAYINFRRIGDYGFYSMIIGHGEYLNDGVMYALHLHIMKWLLDPTSSQGKGFKYLIYAGFFQGGEGLMRWKRKFQFEPFYLYAPAENLTKLPFP